MREIDTMRGTSHSHGDHKRPRIPSGYNTATAKLPAKDPECGIANTPYLKVVGIRVNIIIQCMQSVRSVILAIPTKKFLSSVSTNTTHFSKFRSDTAPRSLTPTSPSPCRPQSPSTNMYCRTNLGAIASDYL